MSDIFDQYDIKKNPNTDEEIRSKYFTQQDNAPEGLEIPRYVQDIGQRLIAESPDDPDTSVAKLNSAYHLSRQLGIPIEEAYTNFDAVTEEYYGKVTPPQQTWEAISNTYKAATIGTEIADIGYQLWLNRGEGEDLYQKIRDLEATMPPEDTVKRSLATKALKMGAQFIPSQVKSFSAGATQGAVTALAAAALTAPPVALTGVGSLTLPAIVTMAFGFGSTVGSVEKARQIETGALYYDLLRYEDPVTGERINPKAAWAFSAAYGGIAAAVEMLEADAFFKQFPGMKQAAMEAMTDTAAKAARSGVAQRQMRNFLEVAKDVAKEKGAGIASDTLQETIQEGFSIAAEEFAKQITERMDNTTMTPATQREITKRITDTMVGTALGMGALSAIPTMGRMFLPAAKTAKGIVQNASMASQEEAATGAKLSPEQKEAFSQKMQEPLPDNYQVQVSEVASGEVYTLKMGSKEADPETGKASRYGWVRYEVDREDMAVKILGYEKDAAPNVNSALTQALMQRFPGWEIKTDGSSANISAMHEILTEQNPRGPEAGLQWYKTPAAEDKTITYDYMKERLKEAKPGWKEEDVDFSVRFLDTWAKAMGTTGEKLADGVFAPGIIGEKGAAVAAQGAYGAITEQWIDGEFKSLIQLTNKSNPSTWMHEATHAAVFFALQNRESDPAIGKFLTEIEELLGVKDGDWNAESTGWAESYKGAKMHHEALAYAVEDYFLTGKVPDPRLKGMFHKIAKWLNDLYRSLKEARFNISPELENYFNKLFATPESPLYELGTTMSEEQARPKVKTAQSSKKQGNAKQSEPQTVKDTAEKKDAATSPQDAPGEEFEIYQGYEEARDKEDAGQMTGETGWQRSQYDKEWRYRTEDQRKEDIDQVVRSNEQAANAPPAGNTEVSGYIKELYQGEGRSIEKIVYTFPSDLVGVSDIHSQSQLPASINSFGRGVVNNSGTDVRIGTIGASHAGLASGMQDAKRFYYGYSRQNKSVYIVSKNSMDDAFLRKPEVLKQILSQVFDKFRLSVAQGKKLQFVERANELYQGGTDTPEFKAWFGDSKVVDEEGKPLVVYHGTWEPGYQVFNAPAFFSDSADYAAIYSGADVGEPGAIYPVYLKIEKPLDITMLGNKTISWSQFENHLKENEISIPQEIHEVIKSEDKGPAWAFIRELTSVSNNFFPAQGIDGIIQTEKTEAKESKSYVVFSPEQIKSVNNKGAWSQDDPRILYQGRAEAVENAVTTVTDTLAAEGIEYSMNRSRSSLSQYIKADIAGEKYWIRVSDHKQGPKSRNSKIADFDISISDRWDISFKQWLGGIIGKELNTYEDRPLEMKTQERGRLPAELFQIEDVFHGAKAGFDLFDHSYMGTGEGQQVYGWGTYITENKGVARDQYAKRLGEEFELIYNIDQPRPEVFSSRTRDPGYRRIFDEMKRQITAAGPALSLNDAEGIKTIISRSIETALSAAEYEDDTTGNGAYLKVSNAANQMRKLLDFDRPMQIRKGRWLYTLSIDTKGKSKVIADISKPAGEAWEKPIRTEDLKKLKEYSNKWLDWDKKDFEDNLSAGDVYDFWAREMENKNTGSVIAGFIDQIDETFLSSEMDMQDTGSGLYEYLIEHVMDGNKTSVAKLLNNVGIKDLYPPHIGKDRVLLTNEMFMEGEAGIYSSIGYNGFNLGDILTYMKVQGKYGDTSKIEESTIDDMLNDAIEYVAKNRRIPPVPRDIVDEWLKINKDPFNPPPMPSILFAHSKAITEGMKAAFKSKEVISNPQHEEIAKAILDFWGGPNQEPHLLLIPTNKTPKEAGYGKAKPTLITNKMLALGEADVYNQDGKLDAENILEFGKDFFDDDQVEVSLKTMEKVVKEAINTITTYSFTPINADEIKAWYEDGADTEAMPDNIREHIQEVTPKLVAILEETIKTKRLDADWREASEYLLTYLNGPEDKPALFVMPNNKTPKPEIETNEIDGRWLRWDKPIKEEDWQDVFKVIGQMRDAVDDQTKLFEYVLKDETRYNVIDFTDRQIYGGYPTEDKALENAKAIASRTGKDVRVVDGQSEEGREFWDPGNKRFDNGDLFTLSSDYFNKRIVDDGKLPEILLKIFRDNAYDLELAEDFYGKMDEISMAMPQFESWEENTGEKPTGKVLYNVLKETLGMKYASMLLSGAGFDGVTYPVAFLTGGAGDKGMNYVVFDDKAINIKKRVLFQGEGENAEADAAKAHQFSGLDDPSIAALKEEARGFDTWEEFANYADTFFDEEIKKLIAADKLDEDKKMKIYREIWEAANHSETYGGDINAWAKSLEKDEYQGLKEFLESIWEEILSGETFNFQPEDVEEADQIKILRERASRISKEIAEVVKSGAIRIGANKKELSSKFMASVLGVIKKNPVEYARIYGEIFDIPELENAALKASTEKYADIEDPKIEDTRLTISQKAAIASVLRNEEVGRKILNGNIIVDAEVKQFLKNLKTTVKEDQKKIEELQNEVREDNKMLSAWDKRWIDASSRINQADQEIQKIDTRIDKLSKDNKRIPSSLLSEQKSLMRIRETMESQRDKARKKVGNPARLQTTLAKVEEAARMKIEAKDKELKRKAATKLKQYTAQLVKQIMQKPSDLINADQAIAIMDIQKMIDPHRRSEKTQETIDALRVELEKNPALSKEIGKEWLKRATKKNLGEFTLSEIEEMAAKVKALRTEGRAIFQNKQDARKEYERTTQENIADLLLHLPGAAKPGDKPDHDSFIGKIAGKIRDFDYAFTKAQQFARILDGKEDGPNYELLIMERDRAYRKEMVQVERRMKKIAEAFKAEDVNPIEWYKQEVTLKGLGPGRTDRVMRKSDIMALELALRNEDSRQAVLFGNFFTHHEKRSMGEEDLYFQAAERFNVLREAMDSVITEKDLRILETFAADGDETGRRLFEKVAEVENRVMEMADNYFPINREGVTGDPIDVQIAGDVLNRTPGTKRPPKNGFTKSRVNISPKHQTPIKLDLLTTWSKSIQAQEHYIANAAYGKRLDGVYLNNFMQEQLRAAVGDQGVAYVKEYIAEVKNPGSLRNIARWENSIKWLRGSLGAAYLGFRASSMLKQFITSPWPAMAYAGPTRYLAETMKAMANPIRYVQKAEEISTILRNRTADLVFDAVRTANATSEAGRKIKQANQVALKGLEIADRYSVAIGWRAVYEQEMADHGNMDVAIEKADDMVLKTQPSSRGVDLAPIYRNGGEAMKMLLQFTSPMNVIWNNIRHDIPAALKDKHYARAIGIMTSYIISGVLVSLATEGDDEDEDKKAARLIFYAFTQGTESIPLIGTDVTRLVRTAITGDAGYDFPDTMLPGATQILGGLTDVVKDPDNWERGLEQFASGVGLTVGAPVSGTKEIIRVSGGDFGALLGKPRRKD